MIRNHTCSKASAARDGSEIGFGARPDAARDVAAVALMVAALVLVTSVAAAMGQEPRLTVKEPATAQVVPPRTPERGRWSWNSQPSEVTATGDRVWKPQPFKFAPGASTRYIDFDGGDDSHDGKSKEAAWKHHPWDAAATGQALACKGINTYVFKRGVIYRGTMVIAESGEMGNPIRLTSDPGWGAGEAMIYGSERITGWKQGAQHADIPDAAKVWYADLSFAPRSVWEERAGKIERIELARMPNWKVSDPDDVLSEWWTWEQPEWWTGKDQIDYQGHRAHIGIDTKHLTQSADYYKDAVVRTEYGVVMGTPFPTRVEGYDPVKKGVVFQGLYMGDSEKIITKNRYYLEDKPQYLASPGLFWFEKKDQGGRLYLRLSDDRDPNQAVVEVARHLNLIQDRASASAPDRLDILTPVELEKVNTQGVAHLEITGLTFQFTNTYWDLVQPIWMNQAVDNACIRLLGNSDDIRIANCKFAHVNKAVRINTITDACRIDHIAITDNQAEYCDHCAFSISDEIINRLGPVRVLMGDVKFLRNRLYEVGMKTFQQDHDFAVRIATPQTAEVAGNVTNRTYCSGLFIQRGRNIAHPDLCDMPLARTLIYGNQVVDSLLTANDWGGIEVCGAGDACVFNNISGHPCGYWNWNYTPKSRCGGGQGMAYYLDFGASKTYLFNNVAWGRTSDLGSKECSNSAFYESGPWIFNAFFNNTIHNFAMGSNWSPVAGYHLFLGNVWSGVGSWIWMHGKLKEDAGGLVKEEYPIATDGYGRNVFYQISPELAVFEASGRKHDTIDSMSKGLTEHKAMADDVGTLASASPFRDAPQHDFRPAAESAAIGRGAKVFVPWALYRTVGEWHFRRNNADPAVVLDTHYGGEPYVLNPVDYVRLILHPLKAINVTAADYVEGPLENWTAGALQFNGKDQYATLTHADMTHPFEQAILKPGSSEKQKMTVSGKELITPDIDTQNLLIEAYFRTQAGHAGSVLVSKMAGTGYQLAVNQAGSITLTLATANAKAEVATGTTVNDGKWHHVLAEVDRPGKVVRVYVDGNPSAEEAIDLAPEASLSNTGDLLVGRNADGCFFAGEMEFLRIARGTLKDAKTSIEELYDWEFDGPFLRDFVGVKPAGNRDAGAFQHVE